MLQTKELPILQAKEGEVYGDKVVFESKDFQNKLHMYGVYDLFDNKLAIKQDKEKYIFAVNGENKFAVNGKVDFVTFINDFYKDVAKREKRTTEKKAVIEVSELEKRTKVEIIMTETQQDLADLADQIKKNETLSERSTNIENVKYKVERLITFFEQERDLAKDESAGRIFNTKYDRKDKGLRKIQKTEINRRIKELNKIKQQIERLANNKNKKYEIERNIDATDKTKKEVSKVKEVKMDDTNGLDMKMTLKQFSDRIEDLGKEAPDFVLARNDIILETGDTNPYYELVINNTKDAQKLKSALNLINDEYIRLDKMELSVAKRQALQQDLKRLSEYLQKYIDNPNTFDMAKEPFVFTSGDAIKELYKINPGFQKLIEGNIKAGSRKNNEKKDKKDKNKTGTDKTETSTNTTGTNTTGPDNKTSKEYISSTYNSAGDAFEKGGVGGILKYGLDQTNMKPNQKQFRGGVGNVALIGGVVFLGWKMIKSAFSLMTEKGRTGDKLGKNLMRLGIPTALIIGSQARSGEGPMNLFKGGELTKKIAGLRGGSGSTETKDQTPQDKETRTKYLEGFPGATALFNGLTYGEMKQFLIQDGKQTKIDPTKYQTLLDMFKNGSKKNEAAATFLESIGKDDEKHVLNLGLTGMGITREQLQSDGNKDKKFDNTASEAIARLGSVSTFMEDNKYVKINSETQYLVDNYIRDGKDPKELEALAKRGDVFYKEINVVDKTGLAQRVKELANGDKEKEENLLLAINSFYDYMPNAPKKIELIGTGDEIQFKTYDQTSKINLKNKELVGFTPARFKSYLETFKAANLTNYIKKLCKDKEAKTDPFHISSPGGDIEFSDPSMFKFDTEIISAGAGDSLKNVSQILEDNKQAYCDYLNNIRPIFRNQKLT